MLGHPLQWYFERFYFLVDDRMLEDGAGLLRHVVDQLGVDQLFLGVTILIQRTSGHSTRIRGLNWLTEEDKKILGKMSRL
jgi:hypothetical protein